MLTAVAWEVQCARYECRLPGVVAVSFRPHAVGPAGWALTVCEHHAVPVPERAAGQGWGVGVNALRLRSRSETEWDIIEGQTDRLVGRVMLESGAFFLTDVDGAAEVGAFYRLEQTVPAAAAVLGGGLLNS
ncbi:hypothetical protein EDF31_102558 [Curtobacterium sp. PhB142]|nr:MULTISPECIES: hypothetical protein [unclassified Curtobacterium]TCL87849.1 hypothetical protein EDF31_102558 [Curtobacterium sp. PhB142]TCM04802.1 hypothetical protein EDF26_10121 [Curtobacterium sp. PhB134]TCU42255.1 hypothetical protein EDF33_1185 [Curtobacterium sp. PhB146]